jgi:hypothetical protein
MTLVIAHADSDICFLVGDTLLSHEHFRLKEDIGPVSGEFHSLKIQILSGSIAVAFTGKFGEAYQAVRELKNALSAHPDVDPAVWLAQREGIGGCEFLVLLNRDRKQLFRISDGTTSEFQTTYIGMQDEYRKYLDLRKPYGGPATRLVIDEGVAAEIPVTEGEKEFDVVSDAMESLSRDTVGRKHATVGAISGCVIRVVDARLSRELEYMQAVEVSNFPWEPQGGFAVLAANTDKRGVGIFFKAGGRGFILPTCGEIPCIASQAPDLTAFLKEAKDKFGMTLIGGTW